MTEFAKNFIDGTWENSLTGETFENKNPADADQLVGVVVKSGKGDVDKAVKAAREAYQSWRLFPAPRRGEIIFRAGEMLVKRKKELGEIETREMGKVLQEGLGDVQ